MVDILILIHNFWQDSVKIACEAIEIEAENLARSNHIAEIYEDFMYVFGGVQDFEAEALDELWRLDLKLRKWEKCNASGDGPGKVLRHRSVLYNKEIYVFGGRNNIQPYSRNKDLFALNLGKILIFQAVYYFLQRFVGMAKDRV